MGPLPPPGLDSHRGQIPALSDLAMGIITGPAEMEIHLPMSTAAFPSEMPRLTCDWLEVMVWDLGPRVELRVETGFADLSRGTQPIRRNAVFHSCIRSSPCSTDSTR